ncbi:E3 ubiquitin-protein ligase listerin [Anastrepha obliqua]|uniref:E3 ubiquitin-protein ligase listerin n=1 Tax=Anastrepha obliqua TaxID=95512 RepID=UPI00240A6F94|nr:E3 ubiquitin-protein ligase listerin [Anastrepha obliqua]
MDSKAKNGFRIKNNAKPSSSSRSAELLSSQESFCFPTQIQKKLGSFKITEFSDTSPNEGGNRVNLLIVIRKLNKKDPITKKKGLEELIKDINCASLEDVVQILPSWSKIYPSLANDPTHNVRELTQEVQKILASKCKRTMAPYLKQLVPVWLFSQFDNHAPAAIIARSSFNDIFNVKLNRIQEVCVHCQLEILEHVYNNLSKSSKISEGEKTEDSSIAKIFGNLEMLSFFTEHTKTVKLSSQSYIIIRSILGHSNFWSCGKRGPKIIRTAWFKVIYNLIQSSSVSDILLEWKSDIVAVSFNGIDECDRTLSSHIWKCILLLQSRYEDWYKHVSFIKVIQPKLSCLLHNKFFNNFEIICPNMLPFYSAVVNSYSHEFDWHIFLEKLLMDLKSVFCSETLRANAADFNAIFDAYYDCWKFILNKLNNTEKEEEQKNIYMLKLLHTNIIQPTEWFLTAKKNLGANSFFSITVKMFLDCQKENQIKDNDFLYIYILREFWTSIFQLITTLIYENEHYPELIIELIPNLLRLNEENVNTKLSSCFISGDPAYFTNQTNEDRLRGIALQLIQYCLKRIDGNECQRCLKHVQSLIDMFPDIEFYKNIANKGDVNESINIFVDLISVVGKEVYLDIAQIIFKMLRFLNADQQFIFVETRLLSIRSREMQILILERLLLDHLKMGKRREILLSGPVVKALIIDITRIALIEKQIDTINWAQILFLRNDHGDFLVGAATVDALLHKIFEPLETGNSDEIVDLCGNIVSQFMPIVFTKENAFHETKSKMFLKLFKCLMINSTDNVLTEKTLFKLTSCWENVLSNQNIVTEEIILHCTQIVRNMRFVNKSIIKSAMKCADLISRFIMGTVRRNMQNEEGIPELNKLIARFLTSTDSAELQRQLKDYCVFLEALNGFVSTNEKIRYKSLDYQDINIIIQRSLLNLYVIKQICKELEPLKNNLSSKNLRTLYSNLCPELLNCITLTYAGESVLGIKAKEDASLKICITELQEQIKSLIYNEAILTEVIQEKLLHYATMSSDISYCRSLSLLVFSHRYVQFEENAPIVFNEEIAKYFLDQDALTPYINFLQYQLPRLGHRSICVQNISLCAKSTSVWIKCAILRCFVINFFKSNVMEAGDKTILVQILGIVREISEKLYTEKRALFNVKIDDHELAVVVELVEYIRLLTEILKNMPWSLSSKDWDSIIIGLSSWVPSVLKSIEKYTDPKVSLFIINVCSLFVVFEEFITAENNTSSTALVKKTIDEWESLFAKEVNCTIFKSFYGLLQYQELATAEYFSLVFNKIRLALTHADFDVIYIFCKNSPDINFKDVFNLLLGNFSNSNLLVQRTCYFILRELTQFYVVDDIKCYQTLDRNLHKQHHYLKQFEALITSKDSFIEKYITQFSFKASEIDEFDAIENERGFSYLLMWDCILHACVKSPLFVRTIYTSWLYENRYLEKFLHFLIRAMPTEILKNHDIKLPTSEIFNSLSGVQINDENLSLERYACHLYTEVLKKLPAVVRKWWNISSSRQKAFVDKLTTNFVSSLICDEELKSIGANKEKHENMQVTVHLSTREVLAVYFMDEVQMELTITLPLNYPLGPVKVDCRKIVGGRLSSRNISMQLALFLTHQNGTILDGLALWKNSLDKKFEGVEECYVCYTVIHQDTCQLPKLTCKTCKKKFHGSCLYKWFTTSSKSTCPICRNVF